MREAKKTYHTILMYEKLHEEDTKERENFSIENTFNSLSKKEKDEYTERLGRNFVNNLQDNINYIYTRKEFYYDIVNPEGKPDYRTIEILSILSDDTSATHVEYGGYKVKFPSSGMPIYTGFLLKIGSNLSLHIFSYILCEGNDIRVPIVEKSYLELQDFFNESKENIKASLILLQKIKLLTFVENDNDKITIHLNKDNIFKLDKELSSLETAIKINNHYGEFICNTLECPHCYDKIEESEFKLMLEEYTKFNK